MDRLPGDGSSEVRQLGRDCASGRNARQFRFGIHLVVHETRSVKLVEGLTKDRPRTSGVPLQELAQGSALRSVSAVVDERRRDPISLMNRRGPVAVQTNVETV